LWPKKSGSNYFIIVDLSGVTALLKNDNRKTIDRDKTAAPYLLTGRTPHPGPCQ